MKNIKALTALNAERWVNAKLTRASEFGPVAKRLVSKKVRYQDIEAMTGVPWFVIAVIHQRESSQNFSKSIAQGDPWNKKSTHVPKGRGPFKSFEEAAVDALKNCAPYASKWKDWSPGGTMTLLEQYNGLGYANKGIPSPYIWSGTDQYKKGKYIADRKFSATAVDKQLGCAGLILAMQKLDDTIQFKAAPKFGEYSVEVEIIEMNLDAIGYHEVGMPEGIWNSKTIAAIAAFKCDRKIAGEPVIDDALKAELDKAAEEKWTRPIAVQRSKATEATVTKEAPEIVPVKRSRFAAFWAAITSAVLAVINALADYFKDALSWVVGLKEYAADAPAYIWFIIAAGVALVVWFAAKNGAKGIVEAFRKGERS